MRNSNIVLTFLLLAALCPLALCASPVSLDTARRAAGAWVSRGHTMGARLGSVPDAVATHHTTNGTAFYSVRLREGGSVVLSSDTEMPPVIGFTAEAIDAEALDPAGPLWALLNRDLSARGELLRRASLRLQVSSANPEPTPSEREWAELLAESSSTNRLQLTTSAAAIHTIGDVSDVRVAPLVKSKWSQSNLSNGKACWNYYTPNGTDPAKFSPGSSGNEVCGCVATAMSQVMRFHKYPTASVTPVTRACTWGVSSGSSQTMNLTTQGGTYDWNAMTLEPYRDSTVTDANRQAIGKLTSDAGITVYMQYHMGGSTGSGAYSFDITYALLKVWGYKSAVHYDASDTDLTDPFERIEALGKSLFANFDAGYPVCMGIPGHAIVADGYGFGVVAGTTNDYVHLNMGWAGSNDFWYNLPDVTEAHSQFSAMDSVTYNIFPTNSSSYAIVSGRLTDSSGNPVVGATVQVRNRYGTLQGSAVSSESGVWAVLVKGGTYSVKAQSADGALIGSLSSVVVSKPNTTSTNWNRTGRLVPTVGQPGNLGNSWGNDIVMRIDTGRFTVISPPSAPALVYDGAEQGVPANAGYSLSGTFRAKNAGTYSATATPNDGYCWTDGTFDAKTIEWSIGCVPLTITADDKTVTAGDDCPAFTATYSGFVGADGPADLDGCLEFSCAYEPGYGRPGETYAITPVGVESLNYEITFREGTLTVLPPPPGTIFLLSRKATAPRPRDFCHTVSR